MHIRPIKNVISGCQCRVKEAWPLRLYYSEDGVC